MYFTFLPQQTVLLYHFVLQFSFLCQLLSPFCTILKTFFIEPSSNVSAMAFYLAPLQDTATSTGHASPWLARSSPWKQKLHILWHVTGSLMDMLVALVIQDSTPAPEIEGTLWSQLIPSLCSITQIMESSLAEQ